MADKEAKRKKLEDYKDRKLPESDDKSKEGKGFPKDADFRKFLGCGG